MTSAISWLWLLVVLAVGAAATGDQLIQSLNGNDWTFSDDQQPKITGAATVPGGIYTDLWRAGHLKEDPLVANNDVDYRWVALDGWTFEKTFNVSKALLSKQSILLVCHGIDTASRIYINGHPLGSTSNMFIRYQFDIKPWLVEVGNVIRVQIESPVGYARKMNDQWLLSKFYPIPGFCPAESWHGECHVNFIRKMQCSFAWDWGPAFPSSGIWKDIELQAQDHISLHHLIAHSHQIDENRWSLNVTLIAELHQRRQLPVDIELLLDGHTLARYSSVQLSRNDNVNTGSGQVRFSAHHVPVPFEIKPWWPNGAKVLQEYVDINGGNFVKTKDLGRSLYNLTVIVHPLTRTADAQSPEASHRSLSPRAEAIKSVRIGFRTVELIQSPVYNNGTTFYFKVNGVPLFMKGVNWIPAEILPERVTPDYVKTLLTAAAQANVNMMRVWGGGVYESDHFYDLADELGILIWQDFMFACNLYPTDDQFLASVTDEVTQQIHRLQSHPSVALWAGNNENEVMIAQYWAPEIAFWLKQYKSDYVKLYIDTIKPIVQREDPGRPFVSSSPSDGPLTEKQGWIAQDPQSNYYGDVHHYDYTSNGWIWTNYPSARFASEYGFQSMPSVSAWLATVNESALTNPPGDQVNHRQHSLPAAIGVAMQIAYNLKLSQFGGLSRFADFVYQTQIAQAMAIRTETEYYRRNRPIDSQGLGMTMGAMYWQLNDVWVAPSWASIEHGGKWKMLHYYVVNMFQQLIAVPYLDHDQFSVDVVNDLQSKVTVNLNIEVYKWSSQIPTLIKTLGTSVGNGSVVTRAFSQPLSTLLKQAQCQNQSDCVIRTKISIANSTDPPSENFALLTAPKDGTGIKPATITVKNITATRDIRTSSWIDERYMTSDSNGSGSSQSAAVFTIELESNAIALFVWMDFVTGSQIEGQFSDNGFIMFDGTRAVQFYPRNPNVTKQSVLDNLVIRSLTDVVTD